jgi:hypothetical protein
MERMLERITTWIDSLPDTLRPATYGALFIVLFMLMRGAWLVAPLAIIYVFVTSATPLSDIARGASVVGLAMVGGALSGLAYGLVGRHLRTAMPGGRYLTGIITIAPYMFLLTSHNPPCRREAALATLGGERHLGQRWNEPPLRHGHEAYVVRAGASWSS